MPYALGSKLKIQILSGLILFTSLPIVLAIDRPPSKRTAEQVLLVINSKSATSKAIGEDYAKKRGVTNVLTIECEDSAKDSDHETISFDDYTKKVEAPVRDYLASHQGIDFIVLTKGVPIRIEGAKTGEDADGPAKPSLDSYLAAVDYEKLPGVVKYHLTDYGRGYAWGNRYYDAKEPFSHAKFGGYLVTRLDGYTKAESMALVTRALEAEIGLGDGKILLDAQPDFGMGDKTTQPAPLPDTLIKKESPFSEYNADMQHAGEMLAERKIPVELDMASRFIGSREHLLGYFSWGSNDPHYSKKAYHSLFFAPGAISDTAVSTSARSFLPTKGGQSMIADLITQGVTGVKGYTDEPLLQANASPTILLDRYTSGYSLAESFYAASHFVGWEDVVVGDPLCCPYFAPIHH